MDDLFAAFRSGPAFAHCDLAPTLPVPPTATPTGAASSATSIAASAAAAPHPTPVALGHACPACTFENAPGFAACAVCDGALPVANLSVGSAALGAAATGGRGPAASAAARGFYPGTLFRFPLRTAAQAATSTLRREASTPAQVAAMLRAFAADVRTRAGAASRSLRHKQLISHWPVSFFF
jgi:hypothetical protein